MLKFLPGTSDRSDQSIRQAGTLSYTVRTQEYSYREIEMICLEE